MDAAGEWISGRDLTGSSRSVEEARRHDAHHGPRTEDRPGLCGDHQAFPRTPERARGRLREGVVQAIAPRHGPRLAVPRPMGCGAATLAGPRPSG